MEFRERGEVKVRVEAGPALGIGELGDRLGRQMRWGRPLVAPLIKKYIN